MLVGIFLLLSQNARGAVAQSDKELALALIGTWQSFSDDGSSVETESTYKSDGTVSGFTTARRKLPDGSVQEIKVLMSARWKIKDHEVSFSDFQSEPRGIVPDGVQKHYMILFVGHEEVVFKDLSDGEELHRRRKGS